MGFLKGLCWGREANCQGSQEDGVAWNDGVVPPHCFQHYNLYHSWLSRSCNKGRKWRKPKLFTARGGRNNSHNKWHQITPCWGNCNFQAWPLAHLILSCHRAFMCSLINYQLLTLICCTTINYTKAFIFLPTLWRVTKLCLKLIKCSQSMPEIPGLILVHIAHWFIIIAVKARTFVQNRRSRGTCVHMRKSY